MTSFSPICFQCKNYTKDYNCKAFPKGIPSEIAYGNNRHTKPLSDQDNDIIFEKI